MLGLIQDVENYTLDIYRQAQPTAPYFGLNGLPDVAAIPAFLRHHMKCGRFGNNAQRLYWTHVAYMDSATDIRDAYNSQNDPNRTDAIADVIIVQDYPTPGTCCAFYVVLVTKIVPGLFKVFLDRFNPKVPCKKATCCQGNQLPSTLHVTVASSSACLADIQSTPLIYNPADQSWHGVSTGAVCDWTLTLACDTVSCLNNDQTGSWKLTFYYPPANDGGAFCCDASSFGSTCKPVLIRCTGTMTFLSANFVATITQ